MDYEYYIAETIVNLDAFELKAGDVFWTINDLRLEMEKENPNMARVNHLLRAAHHQALELKDFEIIVERRKIRTVKDSSMQNPVEKKEKTPPIWL